MSMQEIKVTWTASLTGTSSMLPAVSQLSLVGVFQLEFLRVSVAFPHFYTVLINAGQ